MKREFPFLVVLVWLAIGTLPSCNNDESGDPTPVDTLSFDYQVKAFLDSMGVDPSIVDSAALGEYTYFFYPLELDTFNTGVGQGAGNNILSIYYQEYTFFNGFLDTLRPIQSDFELLGDPVLLPQGLNAVFPVGLDHAIGVSEIGQYEEYAFLLPPELCYSDLDLGQFGSLIPQNANIYFQVKVTDIQSVNDINGSDVQSISDFIISEELNDTSKFEGNDGFVERFASGLSLKVMDSSALPNPLPGDSVRISFSYYYLDDTTKEVIGRPNLVIQAGNEETIPALEEALIYLSFSEPALLMIPSWIAYRESVAVFPKYIDSELVELKIIPEYGINVDPYKALVFQDLRVERP